VFVEKVKGSESPWHTPSFHQFESKTSHPKGPCYEFDGGDDGAISDQKHVKIEESPVVCLCHASFSQPNGTKSDGSTN
jgi:hypothetical protein